MDEVQKFISENQHQLGYIMQEASRQWIAKDATGALTVGDCNFVIQKHGQYHEILDKVQGLEKQWELLKIELEQTEEFYEKTVCIDELHVIHDIQSLMHKMETGEYYK